MCRYCTKEGFTKSIIEKGTGFRDSIQVDVGYSDGDIKDVPALCVCSPVGITYAEINYCPMCGKYIGKEKKWEYLRKRKKMTTKKEKKLRQVL